MPDDSSRKFILITVALLALGTLLPHHHNSPRGVVPSGLISHVSFPATRVQHHLFGDLAAVVNIFHVDLTARGKTEELVAGAVTPNFFQMIGVEPVMGRVFQTGEDSDDHVVILSYRLWQRRFKSATGVVGRTITIEGEPYQVIGVLPSDFTWNNRETDLWMPCRMESGDDPGSYISEVRLMSGRNEVEFQSEI